MWWMSSFIGGLFILIGLFNPLLLVIGIVIVSVSTWKIHTNQSKGKTRHVSEISGGGNVMFKIEEYPDNPWMKRIAESPLFGEVPNDIVELMHRVSADPAEKVISSLWVWHGLLKKGYLVITTSYLRWIQVSPSASEDTFFQLNTILDKHSDPLALDVVVIVDNLQFQAKGNGKKALDFIKLYGLVQQGLLHEERVNAEKKPSREDGKKHTGGHDQGIADEIQKLAALKDKNIITEEEFRSGKQRLLEKS